MASSTTAAATPEAAEAPAEKKKLTLKTSDGEVFEVEQSAIMKSQTIKHLIDDGCADDEIPLHNVTGPILAKAIEYLNKHAEEEAKEVSRAGGEYYGYDKPEDPLKSWDENFAKIDDQNVLFDLILAANYLEIKGLLDLLCQTVANMMKGKSPEEIRKQFHIVNDYTPDEEAEVRRENQWAFE